MEKNELKASSYELLARIFFQLSNYIEGKENINIARNIYISLYGKQCKRVKSADKYLKTL